MTALETIQAKANELKLGALVSHQDTVRNEQIKLVEAVLEMAEALDLIIKEKHVVLDWLAWEGKKMVPTSGAYKAQACLASVAAKLSSGGEK